MSNIFGNLQNAINMAQQIKQNPIQFLSPFNIPSNIASDPQAIVQHLMNNGTITQDQYNDAIKTARSLGIKI